MTRVTNQDLILLYFLKHILGFTLFKYHNLFLIYISNQATYTHESFLILKKKKPLKNSKYTWSQDLLINLYNNFPHLAFFSCH